MKKIKTKYLILVLAVYILAISLTGCKKCVEKFNSTVQVEIVNEYYKPEQINYYMDSSGHLKREWDYAEYEITVRYDGIEYSLRDESTYRKYHGRIGEKVQGILRTKKYDDGSVKEWIIGLGGM